MDPDANLTELRRRTAEYRYRSDLALRMDETDSDRIVELLAALDEWLTRGGLLPQEWAQRKIYDSMEALLADMDAVDTGTDPVIRHAREA